MSDRITSIRPRDRSLHISGVADNGRKTRAEMIELYRSHYQHQLEQAQKCLSIPDDELIVTTYLGPFAMKNVQEVTE